MIQGAGFLEECHSLREEEELGLYSPSLGIIVVELEERVLFDRLREQSKSPLVGQMLGQRGLSDPDVAGDGKEQGTVGAGRRGLRLTAHEFLS
jgi:hypothetical protein